MRFSTTGSLALCAVFSIAAHLSAQGAPQPEPSLDWLKFDTAGLTTVEQSSDHIVRLDASGDALVVALMRGDVDASVPTQTDAARKYYRRFAEDRGGSIVSVDSVPVGQREATRLIYKREKGRSYAYTGMLFLQLDGFGYILSMAANERGPAGIREALVTAELYKEGKLTPEGRKTGWFRDPYDPNYTGRVLRSLSDDEAYDSLVPAHPLTKVRRLLTWLQSTLRIEIPAATSDSKVGTRGVPAPVRGRPVP